jgi:hypothetical protein
MAAGEDSTSPRPQLAVMATVAPTKAAEEEVATAALGKGAMDAPSAVRRRTAPSHAEALRGKRVAPLHAAAPTLPGGEKGVEEGHGVGTTVCSEQEKLVGQGPLQAGVPRPSSKP